MPFTRRHFLKRTLGASSLISLAGAAPHFLSRASAAAPRDGEGDRVLVVLQLTGGNDGLNCVVPFDNDVYGRQRRSLRLKKSEVHPIDDELGFHPEMKAFSRLMQEGRLSVVQGVGYTGTSSDHQEAMRVWQTASTRPKDQDSGWIGRAIDPIAEAAAPTMPGMMVAQIQPPLTIRSRCSIVPSISSLSQTTMRSQSQDDFPYFRLLEQAAKKRDAPPLLRHARTATRRACQNAQRIESVIEDSKKESASGYPHFQLAENLHCIARLIRADLGLRIFYTELGGDGFGGFDNHAGQRDNHAALLRQMSESVGAFIDDLSADRQLDRVVLFTFSEFGRTLAENGRRGTGHGSAAPIFFAGGGLRGGRVGEHPSLTDLENGGPKPHTDFRQVYATVLDKWLGIDSRDVLLERYTPLPIFST